MFSNSKPEFCRPDAKTRRDRHLRDGASLAFPLVVCVRSHKIALGLRVWVRRDAAANMVPKPATGGIASSRHWNVFAGGGFYSMDWKEGECRKSLSSSNAR